MTVSITKDREDPYVCNGVVVDFSFSPRIFTKFDLQVWLTDSSGETLLTYGTHYEVIDTAADGFKSGATVQTVIAYPTGSTITLVRVLTYISEYDPEETGPLSTEVLESAIDRIVLLCQQLAVKTGQSIVLPVLEQATMELPAVGDRAEKFMYFAADGSVSVKGLAELGAVTADETTIVLSASSLSIKDGGVNIAKLATEVTDLMDTTAANAASSAVSTHNSATGPHSGKFILYSAGNTGISFTDTKPANTLWIDGSELPVDAAYDALNTYLNGIYGVGGSGRSYLPPAPGYFLRVTDGGAGIDPDAATRTDRGDGTGGDNVGSKQADEYKSHTHPITLTAQGGSGGVNTNGSDSIIVTGTDTIDASGGNETRPKNINIRMYIYY